MVSNETKIDENFYFDRAHIRFFKAEVELKVIEELVKNYTINFKSESEDLGSRDEILDTISELAESAQEEFEHLIGAYSEKKALIRSLAKLISILVSESYNTVGKTGKLIRIDIKTTLEYGQNQGNSEKNSSSDTTRKN